MKIPSKPNDEAQRLASLKDLTILDTPAEERFDRITRLARRSLNTEIALVSLVDAERQWFKSAQGLQESETPRDISFCGHAIMAEDTFVVGDASRDPRFADNPLVVGGPAIRLYAGHPIHSPDGKRIGTLCVIDSKPRSFGSDESMLLQDLAILVENEIKVEMLGRSEIHLRKQLTEAERRASLDGLTRLWNRTSIMQLLDLELEQAARAKGSIAVAMVDIDHFKRINDAYGHAAGDDVLTATAERIRGAVRPYDSVGRYGGEEFLAVIAAPDHDTAGLVGERIRHRIACAPIEQSLGNIDVTASVGVCTSSAEQGAKIKSLVEAADRALYDAKRDGRNRVAICNAAR